MDAKMPAVAAGSPREMHCHAQVIARSGLRAIAVCNIARNVVGVPQSFVIMNVVMKYDETTEERLACARMLIKDESSDPDSVPAARDLLNVDLARAAVEGAETIGIELRGCTRRVHIAEFAEGERVLCFVLETSMKKSLQCATNVDVLANPLGLRDVSFDLVEVTTTRKRR